MARPIALPTIGQRRRKYDTPPRRMRAIPGSNIMTSHATVQEDQINEKYLLSSRRFYSDIALWPPQPGGIDPTGWLSNFPDARDREIATELLNAFVFINEQQTRAMFASAFHTLSAERSADINGGTDPEKDWIDFTRKVHFSFPTGGFSDPAGSGHVFARMVRTTLNLKDEKDRIHDPVVLAASESSPTTPIDLIMVDDFAGTGDQFIESWLRESATGDSLNSMHANGSIRDVYFVPLVATSHAKYTLSQELPRVKMRPSHVLPPSYQVLPKWGTSSRIPASMSGDIDDFLARYARPAGYEVSDRFGYGNLGLTIGFEHSIPDCTLPIYWSQSPGWKTLRKRS
ncbi:MAG: hypothetical protein WBA00_12955 [Rhodococcus sp. (in: high G+C Gram-positive bacteria)]